MSKLGLIAGGGSFPVLIAKEAGKMGYEIYTAGLKNAASLELKEISKETVFLRLGQLSACIKFFKSRNVTKAVMAGLMKHSSVFDLVPDLRTAKLLASIKDRRAETIFKTAVNEFAKEGIEFIDTVKFLENHLAKPGVLTKAKPDKNTSKDIGLGWRAAKTLADSDIGLTVIVSQGAIVAVEAMEGTDACIKRAGQICKDRPLTVVKVARTKQDLRFDLPVIGKTTIDSMVKAGAKVLAVEAGKTLVLDKRELIESADLNKISVICL
jgi:DUF1009 family protein